MKKNKGFTLIEVIGVIIILSVLAVLIVPNVTKHLGKGKEVFDEKLEDMLVLSGKLYYSDNKDALPLEYATGSAVKALTLSTEGYLKKDLINANGENCDNSYVKVKKDGPNQYQYIGCLVCGNDESSIEQSEICSLIDIDTGEPVVEDIEDYSCALDYDEKGGITFKAWNETVEGKPSIASGVDSGYITGYLITNININESEMSVTEENKTRNIPASEIANSGTYYGYLLYKNGNIKTCTREIEKEQEEIEEDIEIKENTVCTFETPDTDTVVTGPDDFELTCNGVDTDLNVIKSLVKTKSDNTLGNNTIVADSYTDEETKFKVSYNPKDNVEGTEQFTGGTSNNIIVKDSNDFTVNTKGPTLAYTFKNTSTNKTRSANYTDSDGYSWYKLNSDYPLTVTTTCTTSAVNGITSFTVYEPIRYKTTYTVTSNSKSINYTSGIENNHNRGTGKATCMNNSGTSTTSRKYGVDGTLPTASFSMSESATSSGYYKAPVTLTIKCSDTGSGVKTLYYKKSSSSSYSSVSGTSKSIKLTGPNRSLKYQAYCVDRATNKGSVASKTYKIKDYYKENCSKCDANYKTVTTYSYSWGSSRLRTGGAGGRHCGNCNATAWNNVGGNFWCTYSSGSKGYEKQCIRRSSTKKVKSSCKSCWSY